MMSRRTICVLLVAAAFAASAGAFPKHPKDSNRLTKGMRHDPAFRTGYDEGYRAGAKDSQYNSNSYNDETGPLYDQAIDGYTSHYGDKAKYQKLFRLGYVAGYKDGWDFNAGRYPPFGAPDVD